MKRHATEGFSRARKRRAIKYVSKKVIKDPVIELSRLRDELQTLIATTRGRQVSVAEGKEINRLATRVRKLERKRAKVSPKEFVGQEEGSQSNPS